jgi:hypothetical protein
MQDARWLGLGVALGAALVGSARHGSPLRSVVSLCDIPSDVYVVCPFPGQARQSYNRLDIGHLVILGDELFSLPDRFVSREEFLASVSLDGGGDEPFRWEVGLLSASLMRVSCDAKVVSTMMASDKNPQPDGGCLLLRYRGASIDCYASRASGFVKWKKQRLSSSGLQIGPFCAAVISAREQLLRHHGRS